MAQQCMFPFTSMDQERSTKLEQYIIAAYSPPANKKGAKMSFEDDT